MRVAVMMPFGGSLREDMTEEARKVVITQQRRCMLEFHRLKYIVEERCRPGRHGRLGGNRDKYTVELFQAQVGQIDRGALRLIKDADILIGLITERNVNVIYELALRNVLKDIPIVILKGEPLDLLPIYLQNCAHIRYQKGIDGKVARALDDIANDEFPNPIDVIPDKLKDAINKYDTDFIAKLQDGLDRYGQRLDYIEELIPTTDPSQVLADWDNEFFPYSVVQATWKQKSHPFRYHKDDLLDDPMEAIRVTFWNAAFLRLYSLDPGTAKNTKLTLDALLAWLRDCNYLSELDECDFRKDQAELTNAIVFNGRFDVASVPLRLSRAHPHFGGRALLPSLIARRVIGDTRQQHCMYLAVAYIDVTECVGKTLESRRSSDLMKETVHHDMGAGV